MDMVSHEKSGAHLELIFDFLNLHRGIPSMILSTKTVAHPLPLPNLDLTVLPETPLPAPMPTTPALSFIARVEPKLEAADPPSFAIGIAESVPDKLKGEPMRPDAEPTLLWIALA